MLDNTRCDVGIDFFVILQQKTKEFGKQKAAKNVDPEAYIASVETQAPSKKKKRVKS